ncbi:MAG: redoxin domain-containing protein [Syntrophales bacterium LBB04]|nr:redoxin domain-containing protein [Syntrophales bacterium LBB04]
MKRYKIFFYLFFFWAAAVIPAHAATDYLAQMNVSRISETVDAPNFTLSDLEGRMHTLHEFKGKFVMLNFWATW